MRTVKTIKAESEKALISYRDHCNNCQICQAPVTCAEDEMECSQAIWLYEDYQELISEADYAEQIFQAELKERGITNKQ
ncbi:MAG: hypothetical protein WBG71_04370 [Leeuwenhoekiella sp.]